MPDVRVKLESDDEKTRIEYEAKRMGVTQSTLFRLLFKNWVGEIKLERTDTPEDQSQ